MDPSPALFFVLLSAEGSHPPLFFMPIFAPEENKMVERKISVSKYVASGIITLLVFSLGLTLGLVIEDERYNLIETINQNQDAKFRSVQLQYLFLNSFKGENNCPILSTTLKDAVRDLDDSLSRVIAQEEEKRSSSERKLLIQKLYVLDNMRYWLLAIQTKERCNLKIIPILYFYTEKCSSCPNQGTVLTYFKKLFGERVLVFPINLDLREEESMVEIVRNQFNISKVPTIVLDNKKYEGVVQRDTLQKIICEKLPDLEQCAS